MGDVRCELIFCRKMGLWVMGVVENMSGFICLYCIECISVFFRGGGEELVWFVGVFFLGFVFLDFEFMRSLEEGYDFIWEFFGSFIFVVFIFIVWKILDVMFICFF